MVMAVGCTHSDATAVLDAWETAGGFNVRALQTQAVALTRACRGLLGAGSGIILDLGWAQSGVVVVHQGVVVYQRPLSDSGISPLFQRLSKELDLGDDVAEHALCDQGLAEQPTQSDGNGTHLAEARDAIIDHFSSLFREVQAAAAYVSHQYGSGAAHSNSQTQLLLTGGGAAMPRLPEYCTEVLSIDTRVVTPAVIAAAPDTLLSRCKPAGVAAAGLAAYSDC
jgi:Tfp pilus assembly PilM family ATPase